MNRDNKRQYRQSLLNRVVGFEQQIIELERQKQTAHQRHWKEIDDQIRPLEDQIAMLMAEYDYERNRANSTDE